MGLVIKTDLSIEDQKEIDRILAISEGLRTIKETAFLTARAQYLTNEIVEKDASGDIQTAKGLTVPTDGASGFAKGALFIKKDATTGAKGLYENQGTNTACAFNLVGNISTVEIDDDAITSEKLYPGTIKCLTVNLTNANIKALRATPLELVPAPGENKYLQFISASLRLIAGTNVLSESADNLAVKYENGSGVAISQTIETTGFIDQAVNTITSAVQKIDAIVAESGAVNKALVLHNTGDGEFAGNADNDASMEIKVVYRVHSIV